MAIVRWGHETQIADIDWLWEPMIPYGKVTIVEGDGGDGKTTPILTVAAMLSRGRTAPASCLRPFCRQRFQKAVDNPLQLVRFGIVAVIP